MEFHESVPEVHRLPAHTGGRFYRCDGQHDPQTCRFLNEQCNFCKKRGHIERACMSKKRLSRGSSTPRREQKAPPRMVKTVEGPVGSMEEWESGEETSLNWGGVYTMAQWKDELRSHSYHIEYTRKTLHTCPWIKHRYGLKPTPGTGAAEQVPQVPWPRDQC